MHITLYRRFGSLVDVWDKFDETFDRLFYTGQPGEEGE